MNQCVSQPLPLSPSGPAQQDSIVGVSASSMTAQHRFPVISGGKERVDRTVQALTPAFRGDPVYTWLLHTSNSSDHESVRFKLLRAFLTQCALNNGLFIEVDDYGSCGLLIPPGAAAENPWTLLQAGIIPALWNIGLGTFKRAFLEYAPSTERMMEEAFTEEERKNHCHGEVNLGKGKVGRDGLPRKAGEGIVVRSMSWRP
ncbi:hypothetical protein J7T55_010382 [Diaporthe amygdali]|uniref:uncharacterized protein n=1 Tax=Phomopsis amygdali TaxID=1214568 RepID=UPI0022FE11D0|nr:uncharacterized protein J7T55_010382 [Diaporthe amygdali]KAJ0115560.1 hypothetical protein J7T55_010382 [Diaporthe amygdali]